MILCLSWFGLDGGEVRQIAEHPYRSPNLTGNAVGSNIAETCANRQLIPLNTDSQIIQGPDYPPISVNAHQLIACCHTLGNIRKSQKILKLASGRCAVTDAITRACCLLDLVIC